MGLMQQAYDTYCAMAPQYAGIYGKAKEPLVPVSHQIVNAELELTLDADGHLLDARSVEAEQAATIIPVTAPRGEPAKPPALSLRATRSSFSPRCIPPNMKAI